jgi:hypothetical protein
MKLPRRRFLHLAAGRVAHRTGADLSVAAGAYDRWLFLPANQPTSANACSANDCRTGWGSRSSSITDRASPASLSALRRRETAPGRVYAPICRRSGRNQRNAL